LPVSGRGGHLHQALLDEIDLLGSDASRKKAITDFKGREVGFQQERKPIAPIEPFEEPIAVVLHLHGTHLPWRALMIGGMAARTAARAVSAAAAAPG
jgi:hypothetical protein